MNKTRRLAAIMFTDIAGYTAMMQSDEAKAIQIRQKHREVFEKWHKKFQGNILQYYGDGTLSIFDSAIDAVKCAIEMQQELQQEPIVPLRIGIHTGDILYSEEDVMGDGVNVASRVESLAVPGSVFISESVEKYLKNQVDISLKSMGDFWFKNVEKPMEIFAVAHEQLLVPDVKNLNGKYVRHRKPGHKNLLERLPIWARYVAGFVLFLIVAPVLYFPLIQLVSGNASPSNATFTDEFGNTIEKELVAPDEVTRFYVAAFKNIEEDSSLNWASKAIPYALEMDWDQDPYILNVYSENEKEKPLQELLERASNGRYNYLLMGGVRKTDENYELNFKAYEPKNGQLFFDQTFTGQDLFPLLDTVSLEIKKRFGVPQSHLDKIRDLPISEFLTDSEPALQSFGEALYARANGDYYPLELLFKSTEIDSTFAWSAFYTSQFLHLHQRSKKKAYELSLQAMRHRKRLPDIFEPTLRLHHYKITGNDEKALKLSRMMVQMNPEEYNAHQNLMSELWMQNKYEELLPAIHRFQEVRKDPFANIGLEISCLKVLDRREEAILKLKEYLAQNPESISMNIRLGTIYIEDGQWEKAREVIERAMFVNPDSKHYPRFLKHLTFQRDSLKEDKELLLQDFEGYYQIPGWLNFRLTVKEQNGRLLSRATNQNSFEVYPISRDTFIGDFNFVQTFERDESGRVSHMKISEGGRPFYPAIKIESDVMEAMKSFEKRDWEQAKSQLEAAITRYPQDTFLQNLLAHVDYRMETGYADRKKEYAKMLGDFRMDDRLVELQLNSYGELELSIDESAGIDPVPVYEFEKDKFTRVFSLNNVLQVIRKKRKVVALDIIQPGRKTRRLNKVK